MRYTTYTTILIANLLISSLVLASDWFEVVNDSKVTVYIDGDSIKVQGDKVTGWEKWKLKQTQTLPLAGSPPYNSMLYYKHINCKEKTYALTELVFYMDDKVVSRSEYPLVMHPIVPDSRAEFIYAGICKHVLGK